MDTETGFPRVCQACDQQATSRATKPDYQAPQGSPGPASSVCVDSGCSSFDAKALRDSRGSQPRGVIVTAAGPNMRALMHNLAEPSFRLFADCWGYELVTVDLEADGALADAPAQRAKWAKIDLMRKALREFPLALWLDADVLVARTDDDIATHLHPEHFQALALEQVPAEHRVNPNTGVWLMRSCPAAFDFLDAVETAGPQPGPWADQGAVLAALGWNRGDERYHWAGPGRGTRFLAGTSWLPVGWNQPYLDGRTFENCYNGVADSYLGRPTVPNPFAIHFMGMTPAARKHHMAIVAAGSGRGAVTSTPEAARGTSPSTHKPTR